MNMKLTTTLTALTVAAGLTFLAPAGMAQNTPAPEPAPGAPAQHHAEHHPRIRAAIRSLEAAKKELQEAPHDFGGHRAEAVAECDKAIAQLRAALEYDKK